MATGKSCSETVLVLDDSRTVLQGTRLMLEDAGYVVVTTDNPLTVHYLVREHRPSIVLVDVEMISVNGDTVVRILQKNPGVVPDHHTKPVLVLYSSRPAAELESLAASCQADGYIEKTNDPARLCAAVARFLALRRPSAP